MSHRFWLILLSGLAAFGLSIHAPKPARAEAGATTERKISFSGYDWKVKASKGRVGPGSNYFSDSKDNVWLDEQGRLHLRVSRQDENWRCAEVITEKSLGYGTYVFHLATPLSNLDSNITLGLFTWSDAPQYAHREIDIECGTWGNSDEDADNAQFVVQPYQTPGRLTRFYVPKDVQDVSYTFIWEEKKVTFQCAATRRLPATAPSTLPATMPAGFPEKIIKEWTYSGTSIPKPGDENARINLWLSADKSPKINEKTEVIITRFEFIPASPSESASTKPSSD